MKNILLSLSVILIMAACRDKTDDSNIPIVPVSNNAMLADTAKLQESFYQPSQIDNTPKQAPVKRYLPKATHRTTYQPPVSTSPVATSTESANTGVNTIPSASGNATTTGTAAAIPQPEKKGWSKAAKGAVIGGVGGAIGGAIISKKKGLGAVIGGVVGAAGGYIIEKKMDKKDNRYVMN